MPGLFGFVKARPAPQVEMERDLEAMRRSMHHLPTYRYCTHVGDRIALGRIGPSFLNPERQPVFSEDGKRMVVFEGELFDPETSRQRLEKASHVFRNGCDAEVALHAFEQSGSKGIAQLAGAYVGCFYDSTAHACHLFTDRLGLRGCYYHVTQDGTFLFASEMKAIAAVSGFTGHVDMQGVAAFLNSGYPFFERTFFEEVKFMPYGSVVSFASGRVSVDQYWDMPRVQPPPDWRFEDAVEEGAARLLEALRRQLRQDGRIGALLSGGMDSRAIVAGAAAAGRSIPTFSMGAGRNMEQKLAALVAAKLGVPHEQLELDPGFLARCGETGDWYTDGMLLCTHLVWLAQLPYIQTRVQSLFSGYMGDVLYGGHFVTSAHLDALPIETQRQMIVEDVAGAFSPFLEVGLATRFCKRVRAAFYDASHELATHTGDRGFSRERDRAYLGTRGTRAINIANGGLIGVFMDAKWPYGDYDLQDFGASLPVCWRLGTRIYKAMLCRAFPELIEIPCISAKTKFVPTTLDSTPSPWRITLRRLKLHFLFLLGRISHGRMSLPDRSTYFDIPHIYRTSVRLRRWVESVLLDEQTLDRGYYDRAGIKKLLHLQMTKGYVFYVLEALVTFEHWNRFFVERRSPIIEPLTSNKTDVES